MTDLTRIDFEESNRQWIVTMWGPDGPAAPGEPFPASAHARYSKLEQVLGRVKDLGYRVRHVPYNKPNATRYSFEVEPL